MLGPFALRLGPLFGPFALRLVPFAHRRLAVSAQLVEDAVEAALGLVAIGVDAAREVEHEVAERRVGAQQLGQCLLDLCLQRLVGLHRRCLLSLKIPETAILASFRSQREGFRALGGNPVPSRRPTGRPARTATMACLDDQDLRSPGLAVGVALALADVGRWSAWGCATTLERRRDLVDVEMAVEFLVLALGGTVAVQESLHTEFPIALTIVVQGLAAELQRLGQAALIDAFLHQFHGQQAPLGFVAQVHLFDRGAAMVERAQRTRTARQMQRITATEFETHRALKRISGLGKQFDLGHRGGSFRG
jgi:hypothetical protein